MKKPLTPADRQFLKSVGVAAEPMPQDGVTKDKSSMLSETNQIFSPNDMQARWERLKKEGRVPKLADVLKVIQKK